MVSPRPRSSVSPKNRGKKEAEDKSGLANAGLSIKAQGVMSRYLEAQSSTAVGGENERKDTYKLRTDPAEMPYKFLESEARTQALRINWRYDETDSVLNYMLNNAKNMFKAKRVINPGDWLATQREYGQTIMDYASGSVDIKWIEHSNSFKRAIPLAI